MLFFVFLMCFFTVSYAHAATMVYKQPGPNDDPMFHPKYGGKIYAIVVVDNPTFISAPDNTGKPVPGTPSYLDVLVAYEEEIETEYFLLKTKDDHYGWMPKDQLLTSPLCLQKDISNNPAYIKVAVKNNWRTDDGRKIEDIPIYSGPGKSYKTVGKVSIFQIRYAFKIQKDAGGNEFVLLGDDFRWDPDFPSRCLEGWVEKQYCILWDNRIGVYYNTENKNQRESTSIFQGIPDLQEYIRTGSIQRAIGIELDDHDELRYDTTRFPVIENDFDDESERDIMKIAFIGKARHSESGKVLSHGEIDQKSNELYAQANQIRDKDILFVIDATKSMGPCFEAAKKAVKAFVSGLSDDEKSRFRFALAIYRDYDEGKDGENKVFSLIQSLSDASAAETMKSSLAWSRYDSDYPESVFYGITQGIRSVSWREGIRAVIVIGDDGNHEYDTKRLTPQKVADVLKSNRISFYSINVNQSGSDSSYKELFRKQMKSILSLNSGEGKNYIVSSECGYNNDTAQLKIIEAIRDIYRHSEDVSEGLKDLIGGKNITDIESVYGTRVTNFMRRIMEDYGLTEDEINLAVWSQMCEEGWAAKKSRDNRYNNFTPWCMMTRTEADELVGFLANLSKVASYDSTRVKRSVEQIVARASGDKISEDEKISQYLQRRLHIPYREMSEVLQYTPAELQKKFQINDSFRKTFRKQIEEKYEKLHFVVESKIGNLKWENDRWKIDASKPKDWWVTTRSGQSYAWIPMDYLP